MKKHLLLCTMVLLFASCKKDIKTTSEGVSENPSNPARELIKKVVYKTGSMEDLKKLKDVEYTYVLDAVNRNIKNVSTERYMFEGELSWAQYLPEKQFPLKIDTVTQGYNGKATWVKINDTLSNDANKITFAAFVRPTNFYWFTMMQKLLDPGVNYELLDNRTVESREYNTVKMTFNSGVGEVQDDYIFYINPETHVIDQFLFTVKELNIAPDEPLLMQIKYTTIEGIMLMASRTVRKSNWEGKADGDIVYHQKYETIKFNNGFSKDLFEK